MIKFNFFKPQISTVKKPQTTVLRGRVALAITEDIDMQERMFKDGTYKNHFYNLKKSSDNTSLTLNGSRVKANEGNDKYGDYILKERDVFINKVRLVFAKRGTKGSKEIYQKGFRDLACRATNQHIRNYETLKDWHDPKERTFLKALAIDYIGNFKPKKKVARVPDLKVSKVDFAA